MPEKPSPSLYTLQKQLEELQELKGRVWLHRKDLMARYQCSEATLHRRMREGKLPAPFRFAGPLWSLADLEAAEIAGRLPRPVSG